MNLDRSRGNRQRSVKSRANSAMRSPIISEPRSRSIMRSCRSVQITIIIAGLALATPFACVLSAQPSAQMTGAARPWMDKTLPPDKRADMVIEQMTLDEKIQMVHGQGWGVLRPGDTVLPRSNFGAGYMLGIDRLGIPDINLADSAVGARMA